MEHREGFFKGPGDTDIFHQCWLPLGEPRAVILLAHGLAEHSSRYGNLVNHFVPEGYAVYALDHMGHGRSGGKRVYINRFQDFTIPLKQLFDMTRKEHPETPVFLVGHSMGGLIATAFLLDQTQDLAGAVLSGPAVKIPDNISKATLFIGRIISVILPALGISKLEAEGISRDPEVVRAYYDDPLVFTGKITARLAAEIVNTCEMVLDRAPEITLPLMIAQGSEDSLVNPEGARLLRDGVGSADKSLNMYDGFFHEIFNEPEHKKVLTDVQSWIEERLTSPGD